MFLSCRFAFGADAKIASHWNLVISFVVRTRCQNSLSPDFNSLWLDVHGSDYVSACYVFANYSSNRDWNRVFVLYFLNSHLNNHSATLDVNKLCDTAYGCWSNAMTNPHHNQSWRWSIDVQFISENEAIFHSLSPVNVGIGLLQYGHEIYLLKWLFKKQKPPHYIS